MTASASGSAWPAFPSVLSRVWLAWGLAEGGEFQEAIACAEEGLGIAEAAGHTFSLIGACVGVGLVSLRKGDLGRAVVVLERGLGLCREWNIPVWFSSRGRAPGLRVCAVGARRRRPGHPPAGREQDRAMRRTVDYSLWVAWLSEGYLLAGRITDAADFASRALDLAREHDERGHQAWALRFLADVTAHREPTGTGAAERYRQALGLADELGMRPLVAHCRFGLGRLHRRTGSLHEAQEHFTTAATMYREMEMRLWWEQAEAEMEELRGQIT